MDDVRIYTRGLSATEVADLYTATTDLFTEDCADTDAVRYPINAEICDGKDNNCDGQVDEGCSRWCDDDDQDGYAGRGPFAFEVDKG